MTQKLLTTAEDAERLPPTLLQQAVVLRGGWYADDATRFDELLTQSLVRINAASAQDAGAGQSPAFSEFLKAKCLDRRCSLIWALVLRLVDHPCCCWCHGCGPCTWFGDGIDLPVAEMQRHWHVVPNLVCAPNNTAVRIRDINIALVHQLIARIFQ